MLRRLAARSAPLARASAVRAARPPHALRLAAAPLSRSFVSTAAAAAPSSAQPFMLADIGEGIAEVEVLQWFVKPGDTVDQFDRICEVQSDKATVEISSPYVGTIESLEYEVGSIAKVGTPLLHISVDGAGGDAGAEPEQPAPPVAAAAAAPLPVSEPAPAVSEPAAAASPAGDRKVLSTPATRALAKRHKLDLGTVTPTGRGGRVTKQDVLLVLNGSAPVQPAGAAAAAPQPQPAAPSAAAEDRAVPIRGIRKAMFAQMTAANAVPHFNFCDEVRMDALMEVRQQLKQVALDKGLGKFTLMPLIVKATSLALAEFPELNASISEEGSELLVKGSHNIGVAMDTPHGLLVPNIKDVGSLTLLQVAQELSRLQADAAAGKLSIPDLKGGTFTLSNIGNLGGTYTGPVINLPEIAIAGLGKTRPVPRYDEAGALVRQSIMQVSWSADHRVVDGAMMARFSNAWIGYLEKPATMLLTL